VTDHIEADLHRQLKGQGRGWPILGRGASPGGTWELRGILHSDESTADCLFLFLEIWSSDGVRLGGGGTGPAQLAPPETPLRIFMTTRGRSGPTYYVGQVPATAHRVEVQYADLSTADSWVLSAGLPAQLWVASSKGAVPIVAARLCDNANATLAHVGPITAHSLAPSSSSSWD
jgi:hypothetical protein